MGIETKDWVKRRYGGVPLKGNAHVYDGAGIHGRFSTPLFQLLNDFFERPLLRSKSAADCRAVFGFCREPSTEFRLRYQPLLLIIYLFQQLYMVTRFFGDVRNGVFRPCGTCISAV